MKAKNTVISRGVNSGNSNKRQAPNEKLVAATKGGRLLKLRPIEQGKRDMFAELNQTIKEIPIARDASSRQLSSVFLKDRE